MNQWKNIIFMTSLAVTTIHATANVEHLPAKVPQIPTTEFTWKGTFRANGAKLGEPSVTAPLIISGKKHEGFFNLYMQQGSETDPKIWVENLIYKNSLYTITHRWHREVPEGIRGVCFKSPGISVRDLNGILKSSRFVGPEIVDDKPVNHFRSSCLSSIAFGLIKVNIFSDIYVPQDSSYPWVRWLQFGDGVSLDLHDDEWFLFDRYKHTADHIELPAACVSGAVEVEQAPCSKLL
jgi:hypothetical protein